MPWLLKWTVKSDKHFLTSKLPLGDFYHSLVYDVFQSSYSILISSIFVLCVLNFTHKLPLEAEESEYSEENSAERRVRVHARGEGGTVQHGR